MTKTITRNAFNIVITGKGSTARKASFIGIAPHAYSEGMSRAASVAMIRNALGKSPTADDIKVARGEYVIGRTAARLAATDLPKGMTDAADKLAKAREFVELYAAPAKDGTTPRKLRKGQLGRRTVAVQRVIRASEEAWSQVLAECGFGNAQTQGERNAKKATRAPAMKGTTARGAAPTTPAHSDLIKPEKLATADEACRHVNMQAASLLAFCNKNAALLPTAYGTAVKAFKRAIDVADGERRVNAQ